MENTLKRIDILCNALCILCEILFILCVEYFVCQLMYSATLCSRYFVSVQNISISLCFNLPVDCFKCHACQGGYKWGLICIARKITFYPVSLKVTSVIHDA